LIILKEGNKGMKKIIFLIVILLILQSCNYRIIFTKYAPCYFVIQYIDVDLKVKEFIEDVYNHPEKLKDIKANYPEFYDSTYFYLNLNDTIYINKLIGFIDKFKKIEDYNKYYNVKVEGKLERLGYPKEIKIEENMRYSISLEKGVKEINFLFFKENNTTYKLFDIRGGPGSLDYQVW
jgi:hypothetical protein